MPKRPFIPTRLLERSSQLRRLQTKQVNTRESKTFISSQKHLEAHLKKTTQQDQQANKTTTPVQINIESKEDDNDECINHNTYLQPVTIQHSYTFKEKLARLIIDGNISRNRTTELLHLLHSVKNKEELNNLPFDSRTLLNCPKSGSACIIPMINGHYFHLGLKQGLIHLMQQYPHLLQLRMLPIWIAIDGIPILGHEFWPIIGGLKWSTEQILPFIIGVFCGNKKPGDVTEYLNRLIEDINDILINGFELDNRMFSIKLMGFIADAPARSFLKCIKGHNAYFACEKCTEEGLFVENRMCFPDGNANLRNDESFRIKGQPEHHTGDTPLKLIPSLGLVSNFPLDYLHLCCLGVMKKIIWLLVKGSIKQTGSFGCVRLPSIKINDIDKRMKTIAPFLSTDFARTPLSLNNYGDYKGTELRQIMLYTGALIFKDILPDPIYKNFIAFYCAMRILASPKATEKNNIQFAESLIRYFFDTFGMIYGKFLISYNVHSLLHLPRDVLKYGNINQFNAFWYENYLGRLKRYLKSGRFAITELFNRIMEDRLAREEKYLLTNKDFPIFKENHNDGPLLNENGNYKQYRYIQFEYFVVQTRKAEKRKVYTHRDDCIVIDNNNTCNIFVVENILVLNKCASFIGRRFKSINELFGNSDGINISSVNAGVYVCKHLGMLEEHNLDEMFNIHKACIVPNVTLENETESYVVFKILHS